MHVPRRSRLYLHVDSGDSAHRYRGRATRSHLRTRFTPPGQVGRPQALYGHGPDWGYFSSADLYGDELWNGGRERDYNKDGRWDQYEVLRYCDEEFGGRCFKRWTKFNHPDLGEVEIGGYDPKFFSQNGPPQVLEKWAKNQAMFNLEMALSCPGRDRARRGRACAGAPRARGARTPVVSDSATHECA